jgi:hypothetical protein
VKKYATAWLIGACLLTGCDSTTSPRFAQDGFIVQAAQGQVALENQSDAAIHYVLVEEGTSALVDLNPDPETWPTLAAGAVKSVPYREIEGYSEDATEVRVYWWTRAEYQDHFTIGLP